MSPEELKGGEVVNLMACDVWSTSVVMVYILTGHHPFQFDSAETEAEILVRWSQIFYFFFMKPLRWHLYS
jgi:serine/threonine protein kinase